MSAFSFCPGTKGGPTTGRAPCDLLSSTRASPLNSAPAYRSTITFTLSPYSGVVIFAK